MTIQLPRCCPVCFAKPKMIVPLARPNSVNGMDSWVCVACSYEWPQTEAVVEEDPKKRLN